MKPATGFIMSDWMGKPEWAEAEEALMKMVTDGEVSTQETIVDGFEKVPEAFLGLFTGTNMGKMLVKC
jgi:NADPH-dependent curcumin reductase CurA